MGRETKRQYKNGVSENTIYDKLGRVILKSETSNFFAELEKKYILCLNLKNTIDKDKK